MIPTPTRCALMLLLCALASTAWAQQEPVSAGTEVFSSAPNDRIIRQIKQLHKEPARVMADLQSRLQSEREGASRAEIYYLLALGNTRLNQIDEAAGAITQGLRLMEMVDNELLLHRMLLSKAQILDKQGKAEEGLPYVNAVMQWAENAGVTQLYIGGLMTGGLLEMRLHYYDRALEKLLKAYQQASDHHTQINPSHIAGLIADAYQKRGDYAQSIPFVEEALAFHRKRGNKLIQPRFLLELATAYKKTANEARIQPRSAPLAKLSCSS